jgi:hypothetical protein
MKRSSRAPGKIRAWTSWANTAQVAFSIRLAWVKGDMVMLCEVLYALRSLCESIHLQNESV